MRRKLFVVLLTSAVCSGLSTAATTSATMGVSANVASVCSATATALAFGAYTPGTGARNGNTNVRVRCTRTTAFTVALDAGATPGASLTQRLLASGPNTLQYNLYTTAARTTVFGDGSGGTGTRSGTGGGLATVRTVGVFGRLPDSAINRAAVPGGYSDTITVTVTY
jgi:spore coat protein U-like protein